MTGLNQQLQKYKFLVAYNSTDMALVYGPLIGCVNHGGSVGYARFYMKRDRQDLNHRSARGPKPSSEGFRMPQTPTRGDEL